MSKELYREEILGLLEQGLSSRSIAKQLIEKHLLSDHPDKVRKWVRVINDSLQVDKEAGAVKSTTAKPKKQEPMPFVMSAWNQATGLVMDIDEYCAHFNLPKDDVVEYKLVSHSSIPFYNVRFREKGNTTAGINEDIIYNIVKKHIAPIKQDFVAKPHVSSDWFDRAIYTDCHNGMETNKDGVAMYATRWDFNEQIRRITLLADAILHNQKGTVLRVDELGDYQDGWDAQTVRGGHSLPQNKNNIQAFDEGVYLKVLLADILAPHYQEIHFDNICNDNHAGSFGYVTNSAAKNIIELKHSHIKVTNHRQFINHYFMGKHAFVITHGKDDKTLKFGFKAKLDPTQIEKIDAYLKHFSVYQKADFIEFGKGDSHQMLLDYCTSDDFVYFNYPAFSPSSEWVQNNFKRGRSGFVVMNVMYNENVKNIIPKFF